MSDDGRIPSERFALATIDLLALNAEVNDGVFRVLYTVHKEPRATTPDPLRLPRLLSPADPTPEPRRMTMREAFMQAEAMTSGG